MRYLWLALLLYGGPSFAVVAGDGGHLDPSRDSIRRAQEMMRRGEDEEALRILTSVIDSGKLSADLRFAAYGDRSSAYLHMKRYSEAIGDASVAIHLRPDVPYVYYDRGFAYCMIGKTDLGLADFTSASRLKSDNAALASKDVVPFYARGTCYFIAKRYDKAIADFDRVIGMNPDFSEVLTNRGISFLRIGKYDQALSDFSAAVRLDPDAPEGYVNLGLAHKGMLQYDEALKDFSQAIRLRPGYVEALSERGEMYSIKGKLDAALVDLNEAIRLEPQRADAHRRRGLVYAGQDRYDLAIADFSTALRADPTDQEAAYNRGVAYFQQGEYRRAIPDFDFKLRADKDYLMAQFFRGASRFILGQFAEANADFEALAKHNPTNAANPFLLLYITRAKIHRLDLAKLKRESSQVNVNDWPGPILALYVGKATKDHVWALAAQDDPKGRAMRRCVASFFVGEYELQRNNSKEAAQLLQQAVNSCPKYIFEQRAAIAELERLGK